MHGLVEVDVAAVSRSHLRQERRSGVALKLPEGPEQTVQTRGRDQFENRQWVAACVPEGVPLPAASPPPSRH
jgi:hypothetical protein